MAIRSVLRLGILAVIVVCGVGSTSYAQTSPPDAERSHGLPIVGGSPPPTLDSPDMDIDFMQSDIMDGLQRGAVKGLPYSAETVKEFTQMLSDGTHIHRKSTGLVFRDAGGRTRREQAMNSEETAPGSMKDSKMITIFDPANRTEYMLMPFMKMAQKMVMPDVRALTHQLVPGSSAKTAPAPPEALTQREPSPTSSFMKDGYRNESLGTQTLEGVIAEGTRSLRTIPLGEIGNDHAIEIVFESWYSPELRTVVMTRRSDPRHGETILKLVNIRQEEPAAALFEIPSDYTVNEMSFDIHKQAKEPKQPPTNP